MRHLLGIDELSVSEIEEILKKADYYTRSLESGDYNKDKLRGKIILTLFFENSTRTMTSFDMAAKRLGADVVNWNPEISSLSKGENFTDTIDTLCAMNPDAIIVRHSEYGAPKVIASRASCPVINGGDSWREHPSQSLLDALTIQQHFGHIKDLKVSIVGDIAHSRVASSNMQLLTKMGAQVSVVAPEILMPEKLACAGINKFSNLEEGISGTDIIMTVRLQKERMERGLIKSDMAYFNEFGLTTAMIDKVAPKAMVMEADPLIRGVQMEDSVADGPTRSLIIRQVENGIPTRMAILDLLVGE